MLKFSRSCRMGSCFFFLWTQVDFMNCLSAENIAIVACLYQSKVIKLCFYFNFMNGLVSYWFWSCLSIFSIGYSLSDANLKNTFWSARLLSHFFFLYQLFNQFSFASCDSCCCRNVAQHQMQNRTNVKHLPMWEHVSFAND